MAVAGASDEGRRVDFFVSYTGADVAWAEWTAFVLEEAGFTTLLQAWDIRPGSNFVLKMHDALQRSDRVIALLSEPYLRSVFTAPEWAGAFVTDAGGREGRLLPLRVGGCKPDGLLAAVVYVDLVDLDEAEAKRRLLAGVARERAKPAMAAFPGAMARTARSFPGRISDIWNVPARNPNFAGRDAQLEEVQAALSSEAGTVVVLAMSGLGGVGKTQLAIEHAWRRAGDYDLVWWIPAQVPATIPGTLAALAERLGLPIDDPAALVALLHAELGRRERWLVVFDNAEDPSSLAPYLPSGGGGRVLVTSRNPVWRACGATMDLDVLSATEAVAFLLARTRSSDGDAARAISEELGHLPLALEQAGAYVEETGMTLPAYGEMLAGRLGEMLVRGTPAFYRQTVAGTFGIAYDRAVELSPAAAEVLRACAFFAPDDIPTELVVNDDPLATEDALATLRRLALLRRDDDSIAVHRLVGAVVRGRLGTNDKTNLAGTAVTILRRAFPNPPDDHRNWSRSARLLPHVLAAAGYAETTAELAELLSLAGVYLWGRAQPRTAERLLKRALSINEAVFGHNHPEVARSLVNLGAVLRDVGDLATARDGHARALGIFETVYGPDHPEGAIALTNLGQVQLELGDLALARESQERALGIFEAAHGPDHPDVANALTSLGLVLQQLGDLGAARVHQERALRIKEAAFGPDHPQVAIALGNLGSVLRALGDVAGARERQERALHIEETAYGPDHPQVAITLGNLGNAQALQGDLAGAKQSQERALGLLESIYGADHREVARTLRNLGMVLWELGDLNDARERLERALGIDQTHYGPHHPDVALALTALGTVLLALGEVANARAHQERALEIFQAAYGADDPRTRIARSQLHAL